MPPEKDENIMKIKNLTKTAIAALLFGSATHAMATAITLSATGLPSSLNNNVYQGSFNGSAVLPGQFTVNSLSFAFNFSDDSLDPFTSVTGLPVSTSSDTSTTETLPTGDKNVTKTTTVTNYVTRTGEKETVALSFGAVSGSTVAGVPVVVTTTVTGPTVEGAKTYAKNNGDACTAEQAAASSACKTTRNFTVTQTVTNTTTTDYTGNIALGGSLLAYNNLVAEFLQNKALNFNLTATGDLNFVSGAMNVDYTDTTVAPSNAVPEPGSLALFAIALFGVAGVRRARRT